jgi:hypothetical protein
VQLSEGGIPIAIVCLVSFVSVYVLIQSVNRVVHGVLVAASSGSRELAT